MFSIVFQYYWPSATFWHITGLTLWVTWSTGCSLELEDWHPFWSSPCSIFRMELAMLWYHVPLPFESAGDGTGILYPIISRSFSLDPDVKLPMDGPRCVLFLMRRDCEEEGCSMPSITELVLWEFPSDGVFIQSSGTVPIDDVGEYLSFLAVLDIGLGVSGLGEWSGVST